jgi:hypothetical protein
MTEKASALEDRHGGQHHKCGQPRGQSCANRKWNPPPPVLLGEQAEMLATGHSAREIILVRWILNVLRGPPPAPGGTAHSEDRHDDQDEIHYPIVAIASGAAYFPHAELPPGAGRPPGGFDCIRAERALPLAVVIEDQRQDHDPEHEGHESDGAHDVKSGVHGSLQRIPSRYVARTLRETSTVSWR